MSTLNHHDDYKNSPSNHSRPPSYFVRIASLVMALTGQIMVCLFPLFIFTRLTLFLNRASSQSLLPSSSHSLLLAPRRFQLLSATAVPSLDVLPRVREKQVASPLHPIPRHSSAVTMPTQWRRKMIGKQGR